MIDIQQHSTTWKEEFEAEKKKLLSLIKEAEFYHIGSTAIPGCLAQPIIDILGVVSDITQVDPYNSSFEKLGYSALGEYGIEQCRCFHKRESPFVNLYLFEESDPEVERHLRFREYLKSHPEKVAAYGQIKNGGLAKSQFIKEIDRLAAFEIRSKIATPRKNRKKRHFSSQELSNAQEVNLHLFMSYFQKYLAHGEVTYQPDLHLVRTQIQDDTFNIVMRARFTEENCAQRIKEATQYYQNLPFSWWVGPEETPKKLDQALLYQLYKHRSSNMKMFLYLDNYSPPKGYGELQIEVVHDLSKMRDFSTVYVKSGGSDKAYDLVYSQLPPLLYAEGAPYEIYVGYLQGEPVVTGILLLHANVAGIYYIMTIPEARLRGFATSMMHHLLKRAQNAGYHLSILQASPEGLSLYERLGFQTNGCYKEFTL